MKVCFPVETNEGLGSKVSEHFGSAAIFLAVDSETKEVTELVNRNLDESHGACEPLEAMAAAKVEAVVVAGIGKGALHKLGEKSIPAYKAEGATVGDNVAKAASGALSKWLPDMVCEAPHSHPWQGQGKGKHKGSDHSCGCGCGCH